MMFSLPEIVAQLERQHVLPARVELIARGLLEHVDSGTLAQVVLERRVV